MKKFTKLMLTVVLAVAGVGGAKAESAVVERLALTGMTNWGPEYTLIERSNEVLSGEDIVSATFTASAAYRDCFSYTDLDVSDYDCMEIVTTDATTGTWQICYQIDGGSDRYLGHSGTTTTTIVDLSGASILTAFHFRSDTKGPDGENEPSASNQSVIQILSVKLIKYGLIPLPLTGMTNWGPEYTLIERSNEVLSGEDIISATFTASAAYRDCFSYTDLDVSDYLGMKIVTTDETTGTWQICYQIDGGSDRYLGHSGTTTTTIVDLSGASTLTAFHFRSDTKGSDGENEPSASNQSVIRIQNVYLLTKKETRNITVGTTGYTTFSSDKAVNLDGVVTGYTVKVSGDKAILTPVTKVPAGAGVIIEAAAGEYKVPVIESASPLSDNDLLVSDGTITSDGTLYALGNKAGVGFYKVKSGVTIPAGKAYLSIPAASRDFVGFDFGGETTGIESTQFTTDANAPVYNLNGQRVAQPTRGLYIVNGKKVIIK